MGRFSPVKWSPVEIAYLKEHREDMARDQLCIALAKSRNAITRKLADLDGKPITKKMGRRSVIGKREDMNQFFRSNWEANVARWFNLQKKTWYYEPQVFYFEGIKHGTMSYCPDFKVGTLWVEVKGYLDAKGKTAIRRFKKFHPEEFKKLRAIVKSPNSVTAKFFEELGVPIMAYYNELTKKYSKKIEHWET
jgi:hypothetical protein